MSLFLLILMLKTLGVIGSLIIGYKMAVALSLKNFKLSEFGADLPFLKVGLLIHLDAFTDDLELFFGREVPVIISPASGSLFRPTSKGQHGNGGAADIMFPTLTPSELVDAFRIAKKHFGGVGISFTWSPYHGLHVDVRPSVGGYVATWGYDKTDGVQTAALSAESVINKYGVA